MSETHVSKCCSTCKVNKPIEEFSLRSASPDGRHYYCRSCWKVRRREVYLKVRADPERLKKLLAGVLRSGRKHQHKRGLKENYGMTVEDYQEMHDRQGGVCAVCRKPETKVVKGAVYKLSVDHCHKTGRVRGLLCSRCNLMIGMAGDDTTLLTAAITYLTPDTE